MQSADDVDQRSRDRKGTGACRPGQFPPATLTSVAQITRFGGGCAMPTSTGPQQSSTALSCMAVSASTRRGVEAWLVAMH